MDIRLLCTDVHSESAKRLAAYLSGYFGYKVFRSDKVVPNRQHIRYGDQRDKLTQYKFFFKNKLNFPWFTESKEEAQNYVEEFGPVFCRVFLQGQEGRGIVIADTPEQVVDAPVYVALLPKTMEYRVNIFKNKIINVREKRKKKGFVPEEGGDPRIRNVANGYVYCIPKGETPHGVEDIALKARKVTDSDIVGVDVAYNIANGHTFLLEVNSAPSLEGITVKEMADAIIKEYV